MMLPRWASSIYKPLPAIDAHSVDEEAGPNSPRATASSPQLRQVLLPWVLLAASLSLNVYLVLYGHSYYRPIAWNELQHNELEVVEREIVKFHTGLDQDKTIYQGAPSPELDDAWWNLYGFGHVRITKDEARQLPNKTLPTPGDEQHYIVELDVFHQLHCLDTIRQALHPDYYPATHPNPNGQDDIFGTDHIDHCIDSIRQSIQCSTDVTPIVWQWSEKANSAKAKAAVVHSCRNHEKVRQWAMTRQLSQPFDYSVHVEDDIDIAPF